MTALVDYVERAETAELKALLARQWADAWNFGTVVCGCGQLRSVMLAYRCLYCGAWFCAACAEKHFGKTVGEWAKTKKKGKD